MNHPLYQFMVESWTKLGGNMHDVTMKDSCGENKVMARVITLGLDPYNCDYNSEKNASYSIKVMFSPSNDKILECIFRKKDRNYRQDGWLTPITIEQLLSIKTLDKQTRLYFLYNLNSLKELSKYVRR